MLPVVKPPTESLDSAATKVAAKNRADSEARHGERTSTHPLDELIVEGKLNPSKAWFLLTERFSDLADGLRQESERSEWSRNMQRLYEQQFTDLLRDSEAELQEFACGKRLCAAAISRVRGTGDPLANYPEDLLPRNALFEVTTLENGRVMRRFVFSIDPEVESLATPSHP